MQNDLMDAILASMSEDERRALERAQRDWARRRAATPKPAAKKGVGEGQQDENLIPIPPPSSSRPTELYLTMAYEPYDLIKSGEKVTEFRDYSETWVKRILANMGTLKTVKFQRGYGGPGHPKPEQMIWTIKKIDLYDIETRDSSDPINVKEGFMPTHIAIDLGERVG